uniref:Uncharacterized protein n=1 Tax=Anguilla anguilla TaxID=7936 RepID=A0A0E9RJ35_ANGAN
MKAYASTSIGKNIHEPAEVNDTLAHYR